MTANKVWFAVPVLGIAAGLGMGLAAWAGGAFGTAYDSGRVEPTGTPMAQAPSPSTTVFDEVVLDVFSADGETTGDDAEGDDGTDSGDTAPSVTDRIRDKSGDAGSEPAPAPDAGAETTAPAPAPAPETTTPAPDPEPPAPAPEPEPAFTPWKTVTDTWKAGTGSFCAGLNSLRTGAGAPALASCAEEAGAVSWAQHMASTASFGHDPSYSGSEVVGYSWQLQRIIDGPSGFLNSPAHMAVITAGGEGVKANVGCYWMRQQEQQTADGPVHTFEYVYCVARFR